MYPVGKAQQVILDALGERASTFQQAEAVFSRLGIVVAARRDGRRSVPVVKLARQSFVQSEDGDYGSVTSTSLSAEQRAALMPYMA